MITYATEIKLNTYKQNVIVSNQRSKHKHFCYFPVNISIPMITDSNDGTLSQNKISIEVILSKCD